ncbi:MAG: hypothetical protein ACRD30_03835 [Bryobacteraceae bacterium]
MKRICLILVCLIVVALGACLAQEPQTPPPDNPPPGSQQTTPAPAISSGGAWFPGGRKQRDAIVKADHKKNVEEAGRLLQLATELKTDLESENEFVVDVKTIKKTDDIDKLAKSIRGRLKRY